MADDGYTNEPTHLRVYLDEGPDGTTWTLDGADDDGNYTEGCWSGYESLDAAMGDAEAFIDATMQDGVKWRWDPSRPKGIRRAPQYGVKA